MSDERNREPSIVPPQYRDEYHTYVRILRRIVPPWPRQEGEPDTKFTLELPDEVAERIESIINSPWEPYEGDFSAWLTQSVRVSVLASILVSAAHNLDVDQVGALDALKDFAAALREKAEQEAQDQTFLP